MKQGLFLDDERKVSQVTWVKYPNDIQWTVVRSYDAFVDAVKQYHAAGYTYDVFSFDHDLSFDHYTDVGDKIDYNKREKTGYHAAVWLTHFYDSNRIDKEPEFYIHTMNPVGKDNIYRHMFYWMQNKF
jgi:hypothetical protein